MYIMCLVTFEEKAEVQDQYLPNTSVAILNRIIGFLIWVHAQRITGVSSIDRILSLCLIKGIYFLFISCLDLSLKLHFWMLYLVFWDHVESFEVIRGHLSTLRGLKRCYFWQKKVRGQMQLGAITWSQ